MVGLRSVLVAVASVITAESLGGCDGEGPLPNPAPSETAVGTVYYFHNDRLGTPVRLTNEAGATVWRADHRPFGDVQRLETDVDGDGVHVEQPLRASGQYDDALSSLILAQGPYNNGHRHYEPATGRYLSAEPLLQNPSWLSGQSSLGLWTPTYAYARNNPLGAVDPTGLEVPPDPQQVKRSVRAICQQCGGARLGLTTNTTGGHDYVKSWQCRTKCGVIGGSVGVDLGLFTEAIREEGECGGWFMVLGAP